MRISPKWSNVWRKCCTSYEYLLSHITMMCGPSRADLSLKWLAACSEFHFGAWALISLFLAMCLVNVFASIIAAKFGACRRYDVRLMNNDGAPPESRQHFVETDADRDFWHLLRHQLWGQLPHCGTPHATSLTCWLRAQCFACFVAACATFAFISLSYTFSLSLLPFSAVAVALEAWVSLIAFLAMRHIHKSSPAQSGSTHNKSTKAFEIAQSGQGSMGRSAGFALI